MDDQRSLADIIQSLWRGGHEYAHVSGDNAVQEAYERFVDAGFGHDAALDLAGGK